MPAERSLSAPVPPPVACPHCGAPLEDAAVPHALRPPEAADFRYDLHDLAARARQESAHDETTKVRVTQGDIRRLMDKRRKERK